jgi:transketolase
MSFDSTVHAKAVELIKLNYEITGDAGSGHPTSGASLAHLITVLMYSQMRHEPANPAHRAADRLVLSEGHAVPILYAAAADLGIYIDKEGESRPMTREDAMSLRAMDSPIEGHPNPIEGFPFFDTATGSLGQGLSHAAGLAAAAQQDGLDKRIYCIIGDGEAREGQVWEAADFIIDYKLSAVCPIFNCNVYGQSDTVSPQQSPEVLARKMEACGFDVRTIDGHNPTEIQNALSEHAQAVHDPQAAPMAIVAKTVKGWGAASQQGHGHHGAPAGDLQQVLSEMDETAKQMGAAADQSLKPGMLPQKKPEPASVQPAPGFHQALEQFDMTDVLEKGKLATRKAYGIALRALGHARNDVIALDGDVKNSTYSQHFYKDEALHSRFYECRIAEQNMFSVGAGLSAGGKVPMCSTFAKFVTRGYDQIEMAVNSGANLKIMGSHAGISLAADGPSQMALPDVSWFRSFSTMQRKNGQPGFYLLQPSDAYQAYALTLAMAEYDGPVYMRTLRPDVEFLYGENDRFQLGGHEVLSEGRDLLIVAAGYMVHEANKALDKLDEQGVDATLVDLYSLPCDGEALLDLANENNGNILTLEDNYGGGIGSAVADLAAEDGGGFTVEQMYVSRIPKSGRTPDELMAYCGLSADDVTKRAMQLLELSAT